MIDFLKTLKSNHRFLIVVCAAAAILLISILQRSSYDDALDELRALTILSRIQMADHIVSKKPGALNSQPILSKCWHLDTSVNYYLSQLSNAHFVGMDSKCRKFLNEFFETGQPDSDTLAQWVEWLEKDYVGTFIRCEESKLSWDPYHPSESEDTLQVVGTGLEIHRPGPNMGLNNERTYDYMVLQQFTVVPTTDSNWTHDNSIVFKLQIPANETFTLFPPSQWVNEIGFTQNLIHKFGDTSIILGGIKSLGLKAENITMSAAINKVQNLRKIGRNIDLLGFSVSEPIATMLAPLMLIFIQFNFFIHCFRLKTVGAVQNKSEARDFPWIPLYPGPIPKIYSILTISVFPALLAATLSYSGLNGEISSIFRLFLSLTLFFVNATIGIISIIQLNTFRNSHQ